MTNFDVTKPYNELPLLPPDQDLEPHDVLKLCLAARVALEELKGVGDQIPDQSALINTITVREAQASSEIENIVTTADRMYRYLDVPGSAADPATKEALRYREALKKGFNEIKKRPLNTNLAVEICRKIKDSDLAIRKVPAIKLQNPATGEVVYYPPEGESLLRDQLKNWEDFLHDEQLGLDPLIRMAVGHYQFEAIHPFIDGNGRTGRILNILYLVEKDLLKIPVLYLSKYIISHKSDYYSLLSGVTREGRWIEWIEFMLTAVRETADSTSKKIRAIRKLLDETVHYVHEKAPKIYSRELVDLIFAQPYCRIGNLVEAKLAHRETASKYLKILCDIDVLEEHQDGREKLFLNPRFRNLLESESNAPNPYPD